MNAHKTDFLLACLSAPPPSGRLVTFAPGETIFTEGDPGDGFYVVAQGRVEISTLMPNGERHVYCTMDKGDVFGFMAVLDEATRSASARATEATIAYFVGRDDLPRLLETSPGFALGMVRDMSERIRETNRQYMSSVMKAERLAVLGSFAASIIHDLKSPLTVITLAADDACSPDSTPADRMENLGRIVKAVDRIGRMVGDVLDFAREGAKGPDLTCVRFSDFMETLQDPLREEVAGKKAAVVFEGEPPKAAVSLDADRLSSVFFNLVVNAADAMATHGGEVRIAFAEDGESVTTTVTDTGPGISGEVADRLFEPFVTFGKKKGTGLGLAIARKIVEDHGGTIAAANSPQRGAVFTVTLPKSAV